MDEPTPTDEPMTVAELEALGLRHVGRFAAHGHDGRGWLGNTDVFVRAEDYENHVNYTDDGFRASFRRVLAKAKVGPGLTFHGLRVTAATNLAEAGCDSETIAAVTGHKSASMVKHYTRGADQKRRARAGITRLERRGNKVGQPAKDGVGKP